MVFVVLVWDEFDDWLGASAHLLRAHSIRHEVTFPGVKSVLTPCRNRCLRGLRSAICAVNAAVLRFD
jgi:hypothetical protein